MKTIIENRGIDFCEFFFSYVFEFSRSLRFLSISQGNFLMLRAGYGVDYSSTQLVFRTTKFKIFANNFRLRNIDLYDFRNRSF